MKAIYILSYLAFIILTSCNQGKKSHDSIGNGIPTNKEEVLKNQFLEKYTFTSLLRKSPAEVGCIFEEELYYRDSIFNCSNKSYANNGDPCNNTDAYYEGVQLPDSLATMIHPQMEKLDLHFEHGELQELIVTFKDSISKEAMIKAFHLPSETSYPENVISINYGRHCF